jgi:hypothetical protein
MYEPSHVRGTIRSSTEASYRLPCILPAFITGTCPDWVASGARARIRSTPPGITRASGFADYMQTPEFRQHLDDLIKLAKSERIAIMCAEAVPWRCHRSLIADALLARGIEVQEITSATRAQPHTLTPWGKITGTQVTYPAEAPGARTQRRHPKSPAA